MRVVAVFSHGRLRLLVAVLFVRLCVVVVVVGGCFRWVRGDVWCFLFPVCGVIVKSASGGVYWGVNGFTKTPLEMFY